MRKTIKINRKCLLTLNKEFIKQYAKKHKLTVEEEKKFEEDYALFFHRSIKNTGM